MLKWQCLQYRISAYGCISVVSRVLLYIAICPSKNDAPAVHDPFTFILYIKLGA
jgi:hypothetical protein